MLKKVIFTVCLLAFCNTNAYASLPDFTVLVEEAAPAVVKINTVSKAAPRVSSREYKDRCRRFFESYLRSVSGQFGHREPWGLDL